MIQSTTEALQLLHIDLFGPIQTESIGGKRYVLMVVGDFSRYTWISFLRHKDDALDAFSTLCNKVENEKQNKIQKVIRVRSDHGGKFDNAAFREFSDKRGIHHEFSAPRMPQQNGVKVRKKRHV